MTGYPIRAARESEFARINEIEDAAEVLFEGSGLIDNLAEGPDNHDARLRKALKEGRVFVATDGDVPVGFALMDVYKEYAHLEELDVHPDYGRKGIGRDLVKHVVAWARARGSDAVTLATFRDVPWNEPFYASCGFSILDEADYPPHAQLIRGNEALIGFDLSRRVIMVCPLGSP